MGDIKRNREKRTLLPLENLRSGLAVQPDFGGSTSFDNERDLFIKMFFAVERACAGHLDHIHAPQAFGAIELDVAPAPAEPLPWRHRQILHPSHADAAEDRHPFRLHETVIGHLRTLEGSEAGVLTCAWLMPVDLVGFVVHLRLPVLPSPGRNAGPLGREWDRVSRGVIAKSSHSGCTGTAGG